MPSPYPLTDRQGILSDFRSAGRAGFHTFRFRLWMAGVKGFREVLDLEVAAHSGEGRSDRGAICHRPTVPFGTAFSVASMTGEPSGPTTWPRIFSTPFGSSMSTPVFCSPATNVIVTFIGMLAFLTSCAGFAWLPSANQQAFLASRGGHVSLDRSSVLPDLTAMPGWARCGPLASLLGVNASAVEARVRSQRRGPRQRRTCSGCCS